MTSQALTQIAPAAGQDVPINQNFQAVSPAALYGRRYGPGISGLVLGYYGGTFEGFDVANGTITLDASEATIYVVADKSDGSVSADTANADWNDTTNFFRIGIATTGTTTITTFLDKREAYASGGGGGGGGVVTSVGLTLPGVLSVAGSPVTSSGTLAVTAVDPGADRLLFWDDSVGDWAYLTLGTNLSITGTTINAAGGGGGGGTIGKHMVPIMAGAMRPSVTGGCAALAGIASASGQPDITTLDFDPTTIEYAQFAIPMPSSWDEGTFTFRVIWSHTTGSGSVVWELQAVAVSDGDTILSNYGTVQSVTDAGGTADDIYISDESSGMTAAGSPASGDMLFFRISRNASAVGDTLPVDARLHGIQLFMTTDAEVDT